MRRSAVPVRRAVERMRAVQSAARRAHGQTAPGFQREPHRLLAGGAAGAGKAERGFDFGLPGAGNRAAQGGAAFRRAAGGAAAHERHRRSAQPDREHVRRAGRHGAAGRADVCDVPVLFGAGGSANCGAALRRMRCASLGTAVLAELRRGPRVFFLPNPNSPTGNLLSKLELRRILNAAARTMVVIDEAYFEFSGVTVIPWIRRHRNLIVTRTFSKTAGLAGLRLGCIFTHRELAATMRKAQSPYPVNAAALVAAEAAMATARSSRARCAR